MVEFRTWGGGNEDKTSERKNLRRMCKELQTIYANESTEWRLELIWL